MNSETSHFRISRTSNLAFLPLAYFLPEEIITKCPTLRKLPRCLGDIVNSKRKMKMINSDQFRIEVMDSIAALTFPHFGFRGWKEHYSGDFPVWRLSYATGLQGKLLEEEIGWGLKLLLHIPTTERIPYFEKDYINEAMRLIVERAIEEQGWQHIIDVVKEMPCDEDFEKVNSFVRIDFLRKWYHTRVENVQTVSLEECLEDDEHGIFYVEDKSAPFENNVVGDDYVERFKVRLSEKDMMILEMRANGLTYEKIAERMGYKNHSGVIKRIRAIAKDFENYEDMAHTFAERS